MTQHCHWCNTIFTSYLWEWRCEKHTTCSPYRVINWEMLLWTWHHVLIRAKSFNIDFDCLRFLNQQVGLMFAFMCYGKQQKNLSLPGGESTLKGVCCRISISPKSHPQWSCPAALRLSTGFKIKAHKYKPTLAPVFKSEKRKIQQLLHFQVPLSLVR